MQTTISFLALVLLLLLLNIHDANCFVPIHTRRLQLQFIIQQYKSSSRFLKVDTKQEQQQKIETDANNIDECVFQDIEVGCVDELICTEDGTLEIATNNKSTGWSYGQFA